MYMYNFFPGKPEKYIIESTKDREIYTLISVYHNLKQQLHGNINWKFVLEENNSTKR